MDEKKKKIIYNRAKSKKEKGKRLTLTERGIWDVIHGKGNEPYMELPRWLKRGKKTCKKTTKQERQHKIYKRGKDTS